MALDGWEKATRTRRGKPLAAFRPAALLVLVALGLTIGPHTGSAARALKATPGDVQAVLSSARDGDVISLAPGSYNRIGLSNRTFTQPVVIDASKATIEGFAASKVQGVELRGGTFRLPAPVPHPKTGKPIYAHAIRFDVVKNVKVSKVTVLGPAAFPDAAPDAFGEGTGLFLNLSEGVEVSDSRFAGLRNGVVLNRPSDFRVLRNEFDGQRSDGMTIGEGRSGLIEGNVCKGTRIRSNEHPDCIQLFSRPTSPPTADIVIRRNTVTGATQGIGLFNHVRNGVDDGGFDRILIEDNDLNVGFPHAIALVNGRASVVRNNRVQTIPDAKYRGSINITGTGDVIRCGNTVKGAAGKSGEKDRPC